MENKSRAIGMVKSYTHHLFVHLAYFFSMGTMGVFGLTNFKNEDWSMMTHEDDETEKPVSDDAVDELLDTEGDDVDELDAEEKELTDEFGAPLDEDTKSRDWE